MKIDIKKISIIAGAILAVAGAAVALKPYAFWAWADEFKVIAGISMQTAIYQKYDIIIRYQEALAEAQKRGDAGLVRDLKAQIRRLQNEIRQLESQQ